MKMITAPSNLGLRPLRPGHVPGTWRAPDSLLAAGLPDAIGVRDIIALPRPDYSAEPDPDTLIWNGRAIRRYNLALAEHVARHSAQGEFVLVIGGDCSILLGALAGARRSLGALSLVHIDGHSDFRHPGNYDATHTPSAVAGMDLALATGRGVSLLTEWPGVGAPLVHDRHTVQIGERDGNEPDFWADVNDTGINTIDVFEALAIGPAQVLARARRTLDAPPGQPFWVHLDVDVLDQSVMPAVDSPGSPGIAPDALATILSALVADRRCAGMTVTVFDPDLDPDGRYAATLVSLLGRLPWRQRPGDL